MASATEAPPAYTTLTAPLATMSKLPLAPLFSAAHVSKWDALPEDTVTLNHGTQSRFERESTTGPRVNNGKSNDVDHDPSESSKPGGSVFSTSECEISVRVAASVSSAVARCRHSTKSRGTCFFKFLLF